MNQLANTYVERTMVAEHQHRLLHARRNHGMESRATGLFRTTIGVALIRIGEHVRGRANAASAIEEEREIALRLAA